MKNVLSLLVCCLVFVGVLQGQAKTIEISPEFNFLRNALITDAIQLDGLDRQFEFVTLSCYHGNEEGVNLYFRLERNNKWSGWIQMEQQHEYVESSRSAYRAKPIGDPFSAIQFKTNKRTSTPLIIRFFVANIESAPEDLSYRSLDCESPEVCDRLCWCPSCPIDNTPQFTEPTHLIVHHSAGNNESENFALVVESIWDLHVNTNGWDDIGYNWLIDPNGILYQGRPDNYQGAHFSCINENTVGICVIGDYSLLTPSEEAISTLVNLLAFEATEHAIDVTTQSYHEVGEFFLDNIAGHRDSSGSEIACSGTLCPGESFYPMLEEIRLQVSELDCYDVVSATNTIGENELIEVYPNPFQREFFVQSDNINSKAFQLVDIYGSLVGRIYSNETNDLGHLDPGIYFLLSEGVFYQRIIKQ